MWWYSAIEEAMHRTGHVWLQNGQDDDPTMSINFLYISGPWQQMFTFPSQDQRDAWMASISELKRAIAAINNDGNAGPPRVPRYQQWLGETQMFVDQWGENYLAHLTSSMLSMAWKMELETSRLSGKTLRKIILCSIEKWTWWCQFYGLVYAPGLEYCLS